MSHEEPEVSIVQSKNCSIENTHISLHFHITVKGENYENISAEIAQAIRNNKFLQKLLSRGGIRQIKDGRNSDFSRETTQRIGKRVK